MSESNGKREADQTVVESSGMTTSIDEDFDSGTLLVTRNSGQVWSHIQRKRQKKKFWNEQAKASEQTRRGRKTKEQKSFWVGETLQGSWCKRKKNGLSRDERRLCWLCRENGQDCKRCRMNLPDEIGEEIGNHVCLSADDQAARWSRCNGRQAIAVSLLFSILNLMNANRKVAVNELEERCGPSVALAKELKKERATETVARHNRPVAVRNLLWVGTSFSVVALAGENNVDNQKALENRCLHKKGLARSQRQITTKRRKVARTKNERILWWS